MASQYIGERYVPQHEGEFDTSKTYDRLSIVTVTNGDMVDAYISRIPVPVGIPINNTDYWALLYISRVGSTPSVTWTDITNKPSVFPPDSHTQGWDTILNKPTVFTPSAHNQAISTIQGLQTTLNSLQDQINNIQPGGGGPTFTSGTFGSDNARYYLKTYDNGWKEFDCYIRRNVAMTSQDGQVYYGEMWAFGDYTYPVPFSAIPDIQMTATSGATDVWCGARSEYGTALLLPQSRIYTGRSYTGNVQLHASVRGF